MLPKPRPRALEKKDRAKRKQSIEDRENAKVKARSGGQCEVREVLTFQTYNHRTGAMSAPGFLGMKRCVRRASEIHHLLGGMGRRGVKESALAQNKQHLCGICHDLITRHILQGSWRDVNDRAGSITYVRLK